MLIQMSRFYESNASSELASFLRMAFMCRYSSPSKILDSYSSAIPFHPFRSCRTALQSSWSALIGPNFRVTDIVPSGVHEGLRDKVLQSSDSFCNSSNSTPEVHEGSKQSFWQVMERFRSLGSLHLGLLHSTAHYLHSWQNSIFSHSQNDALYT